MTVSLVNEWIKNDSLFNKRVPSTMIAMILRSDAVSDFPCTTIVMSKAISQCKSELEVPRDAQSES